MAIDSILAQIDSEIARLTQVRALLAGTGRVTASATERSAKRGSAKKTAVKKARVLSPEARKRIAEAQRRRWAAQKAKNK